MRRLMSIPILLSLAAAPAAFAATVETSPAPAGDTLISSSLAVAPLQAPEARRQHRTAVDRAERAARADEEAEEAEVASAVVVPPQLEAIAACESGGDPTSVSSTGEYRGKYQFSIATWQAVGGSGDPAAAPESEQDQRAVILYGQSGAGQWPVCGQ